MPELSSLCVKKQRQKAKAGRMTCLGRWSLRGDVLAGDQSHQLAGKHRDADRDARSC